MKSPLEKRVLVRELLNELGVDPLDLVADNVAKDVEEGFGFSDPLQGVSEYLQDKVSDLLRDEGVPQADLDTWLSS